MTAHAVSPTTQCPDENALARFARGGREAELPAMEAHLDGCDSCRRAVAAAASEYTLPAMPPTHELTAGMRVGRYEIERELGRGGMGVVYLARDITLDRRVALKLLHARHDEAAQARLLREAQVMAKLAHPNVVPVFELGDWRGELYLAMELVNGLTLDAWLKAERRAPKDIVEKFLEAGRGLAAAHAAGVVHRDFKPANVLVGLDGRVRVTDFGLSRPGPAIALPPLASPLVTREGVLVGTLAYMAPEQLDGKPADERSDQFAFCVALAEALSGVRPFSGENWSALALAHAQSPQMGGPISRAHRAVLRRGLQRDPSRRFASMTSLLAALEHRPLAELKRGSVLTVALVLFVAWLVVFKEAVDAGKAMLPAAAAPNSEEPVVMAAQDITEGTVVTMDMVVQRQMPSRLVTSSIVKPDSVSYIVGQKIVVPVYKGDALLWTQFETSKPNVPVMVAARPLEEGTILSREMLDEFSVDPALATGSVVVPDLLNHVLGRKLLVPVGKGDLLLWSELARELPSESNLQSQVMEVVMTHKQALAHCADVEQRSGRKAAGKVVLSWRLKKDGSVFDVGVHATGVVGAELTTCLTEDVKGWKFPPGTDDLRQVEFPVRF